MPRQDGYTLIELAVALLLLSGIGVIIAGGLRFGTTVWARSETIIAATDRAEAAQRILREALGAAIPRQQGGFVHFDGGADGLRFDAPALSAGPGSGTTAFELDITDAGTRLVLHAATPDGEAREATLFAGTGRLRLSYLDASQKTPTWLGSWRDRDRMPDAVRIVQTGAADWPSLVIRLAIAQDSTCQFDTVTASCRKS